MSGASLQTDAISIGPWPDGGCGDAAPARSLFNCAALAQANRLEGHHPLRLDVGDRSYLAYRRHASLVINSISVADGMGR